MIILIKDSLGILSISYLGLTGWLIKNLYA